MTDPIILDIVSQGLKINFKNQVPCKETIGSKYSRQDLKTIFKKIGKNL